MFKLCQYRKIRAEENRKLAKAARGVGLLLKHQKVKKKKKNPGQCSVGTGQRHLQNLLLRKTTKQLEPSEPKELLFSALLSRDTR